MDGTLVDTVKITMPAFEKVCPQLGLEIPSLEAVTDAVGYANPFFYFNVYPDTEKEKLLILGQKAEEVERDIVKKVNSDMLFSGVKDLLDELLARKLKMYIASTGDLEHVEDCLKACGIYTYFEEIHCNKPDKELMVEQIIKKAPSENWIMIGDRKKDSKAAKFNGILSVGAAYGYLKECDYEQFEKIIHTPFDLIKILEEAFNNMKISEK